MMDPTTETWLLPPILTQIFQFLPRKKHSVVYLGFCCCLAWSRMISPNYWADILLRMRGLLCLLVLRGSLLSIKPACFYSYWDNTRAHVHLMRDFLDHLTVPLVNPTCEGVESDRPAIIALALRPTESQSESSPIPMSLTIVTMTIGRDDEKQSSASQTPCSFSPVAS